MESNGVNAVKKLNFLRGVSPARDGALRILLAVEKKEAYANLALKKYTKLHRLKVTDVSLMTELVYGTLRLKNNLDWVINQYSTVPVEKMNYIIRNILRMGVYQLLFLDKIPVPAACNESVELAKKWKLDKLSGFVNGLLRNVAAHKEQISYPSLDDDPALHISVKYSHPFWLVNRWLKRFGVEETIRLCQANNEHPPIVVRCNTLKITPERLRQELEKNNILVRPSPLIYEGLRIANFTFIPELLPFQKGYFVVQDESSMLASYILNPRPGSFVIDACSGPGGKTTHLAQIMRNKGKILALDIHMHRLKLVTDACSRLGISIVETRLLDAKRIPEELCEKADYILVDAPCSGLGVIRRRPDLRWRLQEDNLQFYAQEQFEILRNISKCLKKGGFLLYSTCTTEPEENIGVVENFLEECTDFKPVDLSMLVPFPLFGDALRSAREGYLQLLPHTFGTDGFFLAYFRKF